MTLTSIQKAELERGALAITLTTLESAVTDHATTPLDAASADSLLQTSVTLKQQLLDNLHKIMLCGPTDAAPHEAEFTTLFRKAVTVHSNLHGIRMTFPLPQQTTSASASSSSSQQDVKLPRLQIPQFHGDLHQWISFRDMFIATVHNKTSLSKIEKLSYLKSLVQGEAARQIHDIILSDVNYDIAWSALCDRYNNERELLFTICNKLFFISSISQASSSTIRHLVDNTRSSMRSLNTLQVDTDECSPLILYLVFTKLDSVTKELWLQSLTDKTIPHLSDLFSFLEQRAASLASGPSSTNKPRVTTFKPPQVHHMQAAGACTLRCSQQHKLFQCPIFIKFPVQDRIDHIKKNNICFNCLSVGHSVQQCKSSGTCKTCNKRHNTMIHQSSSGAQQTKQGSDKQEAGPSSKPVSTNYHTTGCSNIPKSILATAVVKVETAYGPILARALLDNCSTNCLVSESFVKRWKLPVESSSVEVIGLSSTTVGESTGITSFTIHPHFKSSTTFNINALVISTITGNQPSTKLSNESWSHLCNLELADPQYHIPNHVDILIGADIYWSMLHIGNFDKITGADDEPFAVNSSLGWLVVGPVNTTSVPVSTFITNIQLDQQLQRFWNFEASPESDSHVLTPEEKQCETHFQSTVSRLTDGRFIVQLPWKDNKNKIGDSRNHALFRLKQMEKRLFSSKHEVHKNEYIQFMREYENMGHMTKVQIAEVVKPLNPTYYIPHHFVLKEESTTTKFRIVYDASARSTTGVSLNDTMMVGPVVQPNLFDIILRFRLNAIAFTSDIAKMYRQVMIAESDRDLHRILWREEPSQEIQEFKLNTVTYGTASAPYLATRCLVQLAEDSKETYPIAAAIIKRSCYVDDLQSGKQSVPEAKEAVQQIIQMGDSAKFHFRKWSSNNKEVLESIPHELRESKSLIPMDDELIKTLGIYWNPVQDEYVFKVNINVEKTASTKRSILSDMSKLFDPLGWLAPVTIRAKILMQDIWRTASSWDEPVTESIQQQWRKYQETLSFIEQISIPRYLPRESNDSVHIVGYSDASEKAMSCCVHLCVIKSSGEITSSLLTAKTRVAPLHTITLPRLELNAAALLAEVQTSVIKAIDIKYDSVQAFTDSTIVLGWIRSDANRWKTYVKNRVAKIQSLLPPSCWSHVKGTENPADCASRGLNGDELVNHSLWWKANTSVIKHSKVPGHIDMSPVASEERKQTVSCNHAAVMEFRFISYFSSWRSMVKFVALILRSQYNFKAKKSGMTLKSGTFCVDELNIAKLEIVKCLQRTSFASEIRILGSSPPGQLSNKSNLLNLNPFLDSGGILRVGGRLNKARIEADQRNPILLPKSHHISKLIINDIHVNNFHCGPQQTLAVLNNKFWIVRGRDTVRYLLRKCVVCVRHNAKFLNQQMADLPEARVNPSRAFSKVGVDYAGFFTIKNFGRSKINLKAYLAVFVCLVTRAIHIEVVSSLSTEAFLATFRRFISRRGRPSDVFSDCGTNFVGANKQLKEMFKFQYDNSNTISTELAREGISWHFNPPGAPHMNGISEAGVKSIKYHLKRILSSNNLTYEEFETLVVQIEGILNSRPLTAISSDPNDLQVLTPAHFLIGEPIIGLPDRDLSNINIGRLDRWQLIQQKQQTFWRRWSSEFISRMQQRPKWMVKSKSIELNDIVIIKDENQPPGKWRIGRVTAVYPGQDGLIRVVSLRTLNGEIKRPVAKLCILFDQKDVN